MAINSAQAAKEAERAAKSIDDLTRASDAQIVQEFAQALLDGIIAGDGYADSIENIARKAPGAIKRMIDLEDSSGAITAQFMAMGLSADEAAFNLEQLRAALANEEVALDNAEASSAALTEATEDNTEAMEEATRARSNTEGATITLIDAQSDLEAASDAVTSSFKNQRRELSDRSGYLSAQEGIAAMALKMQENGSITEQEIIGMKQDVLSYGDTLTSVADKERIAEVTASIDQGSLMRAAIQLEQLERTRTARVNIRTTVTTSQGGRKYDFFDDQGARGRGATGGIVTRPTKALIGEAGPEAVIPLDQMPGAMGLPNGNTGSAVNITNYFPPGVLPSDVENAQRRYTRAQGPT